MSPPLRLVSPVAYGRSGRTWASLRSGFSAFRRRIAGDAIDRLPRAACRRGSGASRTKRRGCIGVSIRAFRERRNGRDRACIGCRCGVRVLPVEQQETTRTGHDAAVWRAARVFARRWGSTGRSTSRRGSSPDGSRRARGCLFTLRALSRSASHRVTTMAPRRRGVAAAAVMLPGVDSGLPGTTRRVAGRDADRST